jgi:abortive infection bacteriophage resistance protein
LPPSFITLEITSFGALSRLYENLKKGEVRRDIAATFGLTDKTFGSWLHSFVYIRNMCAHHARIWNRHLQIQPLFPRHTQNAWVSTTGLSNRRMYYILSMIVYVLKNINPNHTFRQRLNNLLAKYPNVDTRAMGFPIEWQTEPLWII